MRYGFINNFSQALAAELTAGATTLTLDGGGAALADASADYRYKLTLVATDAFGNETAREIVDVTAASGDTLTISRGEEGTSDATWPSGTQVHARVTAGHLLALQPEPAYRPEVIAFGPVDFSDPASFATWQAPAGRVLYVDAVEVIPSGNGASGSWAAVAAPSAPNDVPDVSFNNDYTRVALAHYNSPGLIVLDTSDWSAVAGTPSLGASGYAVNYSKSGGWLAVGFSGVTPYLKVFDTSDWSEVAGVPAMPGTVFAVEFNHDDSLLAVAHSSGNGLSVIDTATWTVIASNPALGFQGSALSWTTTGDKLAVVSNQPGFKVFDTSDWSELHSQTLPAWVYECDFSPDGTMLAMGYDGGDDEVHIFDTTTWSDTASNLPFFAFSIDTVRWMADSQRLALGYDPGGNQDQIAIVNVSDWSVDSVILTGTIVKDLAFNENEDVVVAGLTTSPHIHVAEVTSYPAPTLNLGTSAGAADGLLAAGALETFATDRRILQSVDHRLPVNSLYAEPATASDAGASASIIVRGYTLEG